jgi:hypothetical protein
MFDWFLVKWGQRTTAYFALDRFFVRWQEFLQDEFQLQNIFGFQSLCRVKGGFSWEEGAGYPQFLMLLYAPFCTSSACRRPSC